MEMFATTSAAHRRQASCIVVGMFESGKPGPGIDDIDAASSGYVRKLVKQGDITGRTGTSMMLTNVPGVRAKRVLVVGLGKAKAFGVTAFRKAVTTSIGVIRGTRIGDIVSYLGAQDVNGADAYYVGRYTVETIGAALYTFSETKSGRKPRAPALKKIGFGVTSRGDSNSAVRGADISCMAL